MPTERRPSRVPVRGSLALALTIGGLALLMGFRSPPDAASETAAAFAIDTPGRAPGSVAPGTRLTASASASPDPGASLAASESASAAPVATTTDSQAPVATVPPVATATASPLPTPGMLTATGDAYQFRYGVVQVAVTMQDGQIVDVQAIQMPDGDRRSRYISQQVEPMLRQSALAVDSAAIDMVSGATYTSTAYEYSLQSALDQLAG